LPDPSNKEHAWQGSFRVGHFDLVAAKYAIDACGPASIDGLMLTCLDRVMQQGRWDMCVAYDMEGEPSDPERFFEFDEYDEVRGIKADPFGTGPEQLKRQEMIGEFLRACTPGYPFQAIIPRNDSRDEFIEMCTGVLDDLLSVNVVAVSYGETESDKIEV
jgi:hypothetical protein